MIERALGLLVTKPLLSMLHITTAHQQTKASLTGLVSALLLHLLDEETSQILSPPPAAPPQKRGSTRQVFLLAIACHSPHRQANTAPIYRPHASVAGQLSSPQSVGANGKPVARRPGSCRIGGRRWFAPCSEPLRCSAAKGLRRPFRPALSPYTLRP